MTIKSVAQICHEANRVYCESIGDYSQPHWEEAQDWQRVSAINGVMAIADGKLTKPEHSHEQWAEEKLASGWKYGITKDVERKEHPCLVSFSQLPKEQQLKDYLFFSLAMTLLPIGREQTMIFWSLAILVLLAFLWLFLVVGKNMPSN